MQRVSGARDTGSLQARLAQGSLPSESSVTYEGLFNGYFFETGCEKEKLCSCTWTYACSLDPIGGQKEYYIACGMNSKLDGEGIHKFGRPPVNLVVVLDVSGSMSEPFGVDSATGSKLKVAVECLMSVMMHLKDEDAFGLTLFDTKSETLQPLQKWSSINQAALKASLQEVKPRGCTNMVSGYNGALALYEGMDESLRSISRENRMMFLTDARPSEKEKEIFRISDRCANEKRIYTTFLGVGIDFGVELVEAITKTKASNYFTIASPREFKKVMDEDFDYTITPCCFNKKVSLMDTSIEVERVYGSPGHEIAENGVLVEVLSSFPSPKEDEDTTQGGVVLIKLKPNEKFSEPFDLNLVIEYEDREGNSVKDENIVNVVFQGDNYYSGTAVRKAIALTRYANLMKWWIRDTASKKTSSFSVSESNGIPCGPLSSSSSGGYGAMDVSEHYRKMFSVLADYLSKESDALGDEKMLSLVETATNLANHKSN